MAVFQTHTVRCSCGWALSVPLADSINTRRSPLLRQAILDGKLHRAACAGCGRELTVEKAFFYTDLDRHCFIKVLPSGERHQWRQASVDIDRAAAIMPSRFSPYEGRQLRVVFGLDELREKLVAQDAGIDDRLLEQLKVLLVYEHPVILRRARLRLSLDSVDTNNLRFLAAYEHHTQRFEVLMPRDVARSLRQHQPALDQWVKDGHRQQRLVNPDIRWINLWQLSPQPDALATLQDMATQAREGQAIDFDGATFKSLVKRLPRGSHLPGWAKKDLRALFAVAKQGGHQRAQDDLFELRFGVLLEDDWATNDDADDIDTLWQLLQDLPDTNVEGNTKLHEILLDDQVNGGLYHPSTYDITIGSSLLSQRESFEDVMRHEVGHAVHEDHKELVNSWLEARFGWRVFGSGDEEIDEWVPLAGGWAGASQADRHDVRRALREALGRGQSWSPGPTPLLPAGHLWHRADFGPRLAFEASGADWYRNFRTWHRSHTNALFMNFWYQTLMVVSQDALDLVARMPSDYAAMSHFEFFAELYALYYDLDDPARQVIPADVGAWLDANIGPPEPGAPLQPGLPAARPRRARSGPWETVIRPAR